MTSGDIIKSLTDYYQGRAPHGFREWVLIPECPSATGFIEQRIDLFAINCWPSKKLIRIAHEIKISVSDFKKEISQPNKRAPFVRFANEFYFVTPPGLLEKYYNDIPVGCGLIEIVDGEPKTIIESDFNESQPTWEFMAAVIRRLAKGASR